MSAKTLATKYERATSELLEAVRRLFGTARWQASQLLASPAMQPAMEEFTQAMGWARPTEQALGRVIAQLAANGAPVRKCSASGQTFWALLPLVERRRPSQAPTCAASMAAAGAGPTEAASSCG